MLVVASSHYLKQKQLGKNRALYPRPEGWSFTAHRITFATTEQKKHKLFNV